ncbi:MAG TPA: DUF3108 domain-containing protein [Rhodocyclaceae bacterium]
MRRTSPATIATGVVRVALAFASALLAAGVALAAPDRVEIRYAVSYGEARVFEESDLFVRDGDRYSIVSEAKPVGIAALFLSDIRRESRGRVTRGGLQPERFVDDRGRRGQRIAEFDWAAQRITLRHDGVVETRELAVGTLDQSAFHFNFMFAPPVEAGLAVTLSDGRRVKDYRYRFVGREKLTTSVGEIDTLHFAREIAAGDARTFDVWLAPAHHHLPVRIRYVEGNDVFDSRVTGIEIR